MIPNIFIRFAGMPELTNDNVTRLWIASEAPSKPKTPYVTWSFNGEAENALDCASTLDAYSVDFRVWGRSVSQCAQIAGLLRAELEEDCTIDFFGDVGRDRETGLYSYILRIGGVLE